MNEKNKFQVIPELTEEEYERLMADIAKNGCHVPIDVDEDGNILDGHHRARICEELGIDCPTRTCFNLTEEEKYEYALRININRRQLSGERLQEVILKFKEKHPEYSNSRIAEVIGVDDHTVATTIKKCSGSEIPNVTTVEGSDGKTYPASKDEAETKRAAVRKAIINDPSKTDREIARETGTSHVTVGSQRKKMKAVTNPSKRDKEALKDPDIRRRMVENEGMTVAGAIREQKRDQLVEHLEDVETKEAKAAEGVYDVVVVDPPWPIGEIKADVRAGFVGRQYPTMTLDEIKDIKIPAAKNCHLFLWTTQRFLRDAFDVLDSWGAKYVCEFVWDKGHDGFLPFGLPRFNCEFCLYAHIGAPKFVDQKAFYCCFDAPTTGNSEKPEAFYDMIRRVTAGRRLDMFGRRAIDDFDSWGKEAVDNDPKHTEPHGADANDFTFADLFSGIGGIRLGFEAVGGRCVFSSEIDTAARKTYEANFGETPAGDITKIDATNIPDFYILVAGFPCQPFSVIGKQAGFKDETSGTLFFEIERVLQEKQPQAFLLENVKNLVTHEKGETFRTIKAHLEAIGYHVHAKVLNSLDFGVPQNRKRLIIVGFLDDVKFTFPDPVSDEAKKSLLDILETAVDQKYYVDETVKSSRLARVKNKNFPKPYISHENLSGGVTPHEFSGTLLANASTNYLLVNDERRLTEREMLRLQGFPDGFKIIGSYNQVKKQCGNSVTVPVIAAVAKQMVSALNAQNPEDAAQWRDE